MKPQSVCGYFVSRITVKPQSVCDYFVSRITVKPRIIHRDVARPLFIGQK